MGGSGEYGVHVAEDIESELSCFTIGIAGWVGSGDYQYDIRTCLDSLSQGTEKGPNVGQCGIEAGFIHPVEPLHEFVNQDKTRLLSQELTNILRPGAGQVLVVALELIKGVLTAQLPCHLPDK